MFKHDHQELLNTLGGKQTGTAFKLPKSIDMVDYKYTYSKVFCGDKQSCSQRGSPRTDNILDKSVIIQYEALHNDISNSFIK